MKKVIKNISSFAVAIAISITTLGSSGVTVYAENTSSVEMSQLEQLGIYTDSSDLLHATGDEEYEKYIENATEGASDTQTADVAEDSSASLPSAVDNSTSRFFPEIGDQGGIGSCQYWAEYYYCMSYQYNKYMNTSISDATTFSPRWYYSNHISSGMFEPFYIYKYTGMTIDRCPLENFSSSQYNGSDFPADTDYDWLLSSRIKMKKEQVFSLNAIKEAVNAGNVIQISTSAYWFNYKKIDGTLSDSNKKQAGKSIIVACMGKTGSNTGGHAITVVGYDDNIWVDLNADGKIDAGEKGALKIANSWGKSWGNDGYMWIAYDAINENSSYIPVPEGYTRRAVISALPNGSYTNSYFKIEEVNDVPECYVKANVTTKCHQISIETRHKNENEYISYGGRSWMTDTYNYKGTIGSETAEIAVPCINKDNIKYTSIYCSKDKDAILNSLTFVDNKNQKSYKIDVNAKIDTYKSYNSMGTNEVPYFTSLSAEYKKGFVSGKVNAKDTASGIKYQLQYELEGSDTKNNITVNADGTYKFKPEQNGYYRIYAKATDKNNKFATKTTVVKVKGICAEPVKSLTVDDMTVNYVAGTQIHIALDPDADVDNLKFRYGSKVNGRTYYFNGGSYTTSLNCAAEFYNTSGAIMDVSKLKDMMGNNTIFVEAYNTDTEQTYTKYLYNVMVEGLKVTKFEVSKESGIQVGDKITFKATAINACGAYNNPHAMYYIIKDGVEKCISPMFMYSMGATWTPTESGEYELRCEVSDYYGQKVTIERQYTVSPADVLTIYYDHANWTQANIHFKTENGNWTQVPGVRMEETDDVSGYKWKYEIPIEDDNSSYVDVCFNNGNGDWDSRNAQNYRLGVGTYGIKNGNVETLGFCVTDFTTSVESGKYLDTAYNQRFQAQAAFGSGNYEYRFGVNFKGNEYTTEYSENSSKNIDLAGLTGLNNADLAGTYTLFVDAKDVTTGQVVRKTIENYVIKPMEIKLSANYENNSTVKTGTRVDLHITFNGAYAIRYASSYYDIYKDGAFYSTERGYFDYQYGFYGTWIPSEEGNYEIEAHFSDAWGQTDTDSMHINVRNSNTVTVYYNNSSWSNANIHYQVDNGWWTDVPGVQMQASDREGYTWMYTIDLNDQNGANVCFNDGNNNWDSRNGSNYRVGVGSYAIQNGNITSLN